MSRANLAWLLGIPAVAFLGLSLAISAPKRDKDYELIGLVVDVLNEVDHKYVRELDADTKRRLVEDMINGGLERLDPHSNFINPKEYKQFNHVSEGEFGGIGIQISTDRLTGQLIVISPMVGTPAYEAGVLAGDLIVKINGKATENMRLSEAVELIQGEPGEKITLTVLHEGTRKPVDLEMTRAKIEVQSVLGDVRKADNPKEWEYVVDKENKIGYIRLVAFHKNTAGDLRKLVEQLQKDGIRGLVLDLRNNPGGLLKSAVAVSDLFLVGGRIVSTSGRNKQEEVYDAEEAGTVLLPAKDYPMAVLINKYSASASEIVAAALQDNNRAVIVGERSYGKGSVQNVIEMENRTSALKLTTALYTRPNGHNIHRFPDSKDSDEWGVKPNDTGFKLTVETLSALQTGGVPEGVLGKLKAFPQKRFPAEKEYLDEFEKLLNADEIGKYRVELIKHADRGFEVPLTAEERYQFGVWRQDRDVVHGRSGGSTTTKPKPDKNGKEKKPFEDKVLKRALEYLRGEIKKT